MPAKLQLCHFTCNVRIEELNTQTALQWKKKSEEPLVKALKDWAKRSTFQEIERV